MCASVLTDTHVQEANQLRDKEIHRLGKELEKGPDMEKLQLQQKNNAHESIILTLNQQVLSPFCVLLQSSVVAKIEYLTAQLSTSEEQLTEKGQLEKAYEDSERKRQQKEKECAKEKERNEQMSKQVMTLFIFIVSSNSSTSV